MNDVTNCNATVEGSGVWVVAEDTREEITELTLPLVCEARKLGSKLGPVSILMAGRGAGLLARRAGFYGADRAVVVGSDSSTEFSPRSLAHQVMNLVRTHTPRLVLFPSTKRSVEIAALVSARLSFPLVTNGIRLNIDEQSRVLVTKPAYGGNIYRTFAGNPGFPLLVTIRQGVATLDRPDKSRRIALVEVPCETIAGAEAVKVMAVIDQDPATQNLSEAQVVVGCGRGLGHRNNLRLLEELAELLGGTIGGTRVAIDAGWIPFSKQIGQTGKTIAPRLYIACGISGASHHLAGVQDSKLIVAINKDRNAPIFKMADIAVVGDLLEVIPEMIAEIRNNQVKANNRIQK
jgi:electron transfer flavoprotein alpha subunit